MTLVRVKIHEDELARLEQRAAEAVAEGRDVLVHPVALVIFIEAYRNRPDDLETPEHIGT